LNVRRKSGIRIAVETVGRILLLTCIFTLIGFAVGLFCGIGAGLLYGLVRHIPADMTMAYRFVAVPFALMAALIGFCTMVYLEVRRLRRPAGIDPASALPRTS
jgi:ABC-type antimicrobial peptide transport system permease subunit